MTISQDIGIRCGHIPQSFDGFFRFGLLDDPHYRIDDNHGQDNRRVHDFMTDNR